MKYINSTSPKKDSLDFGRNPGPAKDNVIEFPRGERPKDDHNPYADPKVGAEFERLNAKDRAKVDAALGAIGKLKAKLAANRKSKHGGGNLNERDPRSELEMLLDRLEALLLEARKLLNQIPDNEGSAQLLALKTRELKTRIEELFKEMIAVASDRELEALLPVLEVLLGPSHPLVRMVNAKLGGRRGFAIGMGRDLARQKS